MSTAKKCFPATDNKRSSFATTCNRLSFFLKQKKGSIRDLEHFDVKGKPETSSPATVDLLSSTVQPWAKIDDETINHLPQYVSLDSFCEPDDSTNKSGSYEPAMQSKTTQMTIFYRGQVLVFDCISADKARDLILAASGGSASANYKQIQNRIQSDSQLQTVPGPPVDGSDLPIARRASLHRFLAKRKDRATVTAPYQLHNPSMASAYPNHKFDLNK